MILSDTIKPLAGRAKSGNDRLKIKLQVSQLFFSDRKIRTKRQCFSTLWQRIVTTNKLISGDL